ncbi:hypothetical protein SEPCBS57363_003635 [Sporothrix epigloea]|uniref:PLD phosphodiesterase domain-containing protein n=1 Tax=Sporothrix epigloea TaxID=1892477 RepID=A0ABP0DPB9_9PEZI
MADPHNFTRTLITQLQTVSADVAASELPAYHYHGVPGKDNDNDAVDVATDLVGQFATSCTPHTFRLGTGASQFASALLPALLRARHEVIFVTCFWAKSKSLSDLSEALIRLATARSTSTSVRPLRIRICLSSRSLLQKLLHTSSRDGYTYPMTTWVSQLGLPPPDILATGGIDLSVKSLFFLPFSVMHPKYMIVDRQLAFLPSCNVSWEPWLEDCVEVTGDAVGLLVSFYAQTWGDDLPKWQDERDSLLAEADNNNALAFAPAPQGYDIGHVDEDGPGSVLVRFRSSTASIPTVILPSSHHRNPLFRPFPWQDYAPPPPTPLNLAILQLLRTATRRIYIQSPNLTAEAVIEDVLAALARGVDVDIVTGEHMMVFEQILTAGTTTSRCIRGLLKRYSALLQQGEQNGIGCLTVKYYKYLEQPRHISDEEQAIISNQAHATPFAPSASTNKSGFAVDMEQPVQSHVKLSIFDGEHTVLGSGNMDRASFFTSQELGILFHSTILAEAVRTAVERVLEGRLKQVYPDSSSG